MGRVTQVAFQLDDDDLGEIDNVASQQSLARAEVLRIAVRAFLAQRREAEIEARLIAGYGDRPPGREDEELAEVSLDGLRAADLDW